MEIEDLLHIFGFFNSVFLETISWQFWRDEIFLFFKFFFLKPYHGNFDKMNSI